MRSKSLRDTYAIAREILPRGRIFALYGDLGAGKTAFVAGMAEALGIRERILSPTFTLMRRYGNFIHIDAYRLHGPEDLALLGWNDLVRDSRNVIVVEWADRVESALPRDVIRVRFTHVSDHERTIDIEDPCPR